MAKLVQKMAHNTLVNYASFKFKYNISKCSIRKRKPRFKFFHRYGKCMEVDYNNSLDSNKIRSSTGLAVNWFSAIGPLTFSYAIPLTDSDTDVTEV